MVRFRDRVDAGRQLAERLAPYRAHQPLILGLPRGGVPVAAEVARALGAPLDVMVVRKLGLPGQPELAMGAIGEDGARVSVEDVMRLASPALVAEVEAAERKELRRRVETWRAGRPAVPLAGRTVVIVDDGVATGATAAAACAVARSRDAARVVFAAPVAAPEAVAELHRRADDVVVLAAPRDFIAVGRWYGDFTPTTDDEVTRLLAGSGSW